MNHHSNTVTFSRRAVNACTLAGLLVVALSSAGSACADTAVGIDRSAPIISIRDIDIDAPLSKVWAIQTNISAWPTWRPTVSAAHHDGELSVGSAFPWEEGGLQIVSTVRDIVPKRRMVWTGPAQGIFAVHVWEFQETARGVHVHTEESWSGDVVRVNAASLQPLLDGALQEWLQRLKRASEAK